MAGKRAQGSGSVTARPGYRGVWRLRWRGVDGKQRETTFRGSRSAADAELRRQLQLAGQAPVGEVEAPAAGRRIGEVLDQYVRNLEAKAASPRSIDEARRTVGGETGRLRSLRPMLVEQLGPDHLDDLYRSWTADGLAASTVRRYHAVLSSALADAVRYGWIVANPCARVATLPKLKAPSADVPLTLEDAGRMIDAAEGRGDLDMAAAIHLGLAVGARRGELCALRWSDVDLDGASIRITGSVVKDDSSATGWTRKTTKTGRERVVHIGARTVARSSAPARAAPARRARRRAAARSPGHDHRPAGKLAETVGVSGRFHDLRHASASYKLAAGVDPLTVTALHGWSSVRMVDCYGHALDASKRDAADVMDALLPELSA